jgi:DNA-binding SARP family transcriptional activator
VTARSQQGLLAVEAFGRLSISDGSVSRGPGDFGGPRPKQVLEILIAARGRLVPTERIAHLLWGDDLPENPSGAIQTFVSTLRRNLTSDRRLARELIVTEREAYRFATELVDLDLDRFDDLLERSAREPTHSGRMLLEEALSLARGEVFEDEPYGTYVFDLRASYQGRVLGARLDAADAALGERVFAAALAHAETAIDIDPFSERARRAEMLALYATGRAHEALGRYRSFRIELDNQLGLDPSPESRKLEAAMLRHDPVETLLPRPIRGERTRANRPAPRLLGRTSELQLLGTAVEDALAGTQTLIRVEGATGIGKTRMLEELERCLTGVRVGHAACSRVEQHLPYVPLASALRSALSDLDISAAGSPALQAVLPELALTGATHSFDELETVESVVALLTAHAPVVLLIDDLHLADLPTIAAIGYLRRRTARNPVAVVFTSCEGSECARQVDADFIVHLDALTTDDLAALNVPGLFEMTGGHPRFIADSLTNNQRPPTRSRSLADALRAQCLAEGDDAYRILATAAVLGQPFLPEVLGEALQMPVLQLIDELERLCQHRVLAVDGLGFRFRYDLVRQVLAEDVSPARRQLILGAPREAGVPHRAAERQGS